MNNICPVIAGPTAVGKTGLVISLANRFPIEVISLDSRQIYNGMRIGTAQPSAAEQSACKHHLIDFLTPNDSYSAQTFRNDFIKIHSDITDRGKLPILVGGAGLYLTALEKGLLVIPQEGLQSVRNQLDLLPDQKIRDDLKQFDLPSFNRIHPNDRYRSQRALEIFMSTGKTMSHHIEDQKESPASGLKFPLLFLNRERSELHHRIEQRTNIMLQSGWIDETSELLKIHSADSPGMRSIGYHEIAMYLDGKLNRESLSKRIIEVTRQYAKRQITWFKIKSHFLSCSPDDSGAISKFNKFIETIIMEQK
jgi:tRNA dimethylallyltransferase